MEPEDLRELGPTYSSFSSVSGANNAIYSARGTNPCGRHFNTANAHPYNSRFAEDQEDGPTTLVKPTEVKLDEWHGWRNVDEKPLICKQVIECNHPYAPSMLQRQY